MPLCGGGQRRTCILDGDTIWLKGEKIRLEGYNAPEMAGACAAEKRLARQARDELKRLLHNVSFTVERNGYDAYGRTLAVIKTPRGDVSDVMVSRKLAHYWHGHKEDWCD